MAAMVSGHPSIRVERLIMFLNIREIKCLVYFVQRQENIHQ